MYKCYKVNKNINRIQPKMVVEWHLMPLLLALRPSKNTSPDLVTNLYFPSENPDDKENYNTALNFRFYLDD